MIRRGASLLWLTLLILLLMAAAPARADDLTPEIQEMAQLINAERAQAGLPPYRLVPLLSQAAFCAGGTSSLKIER